MIGKNIVILSILTLMPACTATYSFAPPAVNLARASTGDERNCAFKSRANQFGIRDGSANGIPQTAVGAIDLAENFVVAYRCAARQLADGRQDFELPATLSLIGGTTAAALGAAPVAAIATGTTSALYNAGKAYYDPQAKLASVRSAQTAAVCVYATSTGAESYQLKQLQTFAFGLHRAADGNQSDDGSRALIAMLQMKVADDNRKFFGEVYGALLSIDTILGEKLASAGKINLEDLKKALKEIEQNPPATSTTPGSKLNLQTALANEINFAELHKKLQECVLKARI